jgi:hypothetical protein
MDDRVKSIIFGNFAIIISFPLLTPQVNFILLSLLNEGEPADANNMWITMLTKLIDRARVRLALFMLDRNGLVSLCRKRTRKCVLKFFRLGRKCAE